MDKNFNCEILVRQDKVTDRYRFDDFRVATAIENLLCNIEHIDFKYNYNKENTDEVITKDRYVARLKADMVAMLTEIQFDIEEHIMTNGVTNQDTWNECIACCSRVIQQKIDALKEDTDET